LQLIALGRRSVLTLGEKACACKRPRGDHCSQVIRAW
jgi:hypothetical protein